MHKKIGAETIVQMCMGITDGERVGIVFEKEKKQMALDLKETATQVGALVDLIPVESAVNSAGELTLSLDDYEVLFFAVSKNQIQSYGHKPWKKKLCERGTRLGFVSGDISKINPESVAEQQNITNIVSRHMVEASSVRVETDKGTHLEFSIEGRNGIPLTNILVNKGAWGCLPDFSEVPVAPVEGTAKGTAVIDGMVTGLGIVDEPIKLEIQNGLITSISGGKIAQELAALLDSAGENSRNVAELGLGTNPFVNELTGTFDDKKMLGTAHIGIGDNLNLGGITKSSIHIDALMFDVRIYLDGQLFISKGKIIQTP